jgi:hypothetical protein
MTVASTQPLGAGPGSTPCAPPYRAASYGVALTDLIVNAGGLRGPAAVVDAVAGRRIRRRSRTPQ